MASSLRQQQALRSVRASQPCRASIARCTAQLPAPQRSTRSQAAVTEQLTDMAHRAGSAVLAGALTLSLLAGPAAARPSGVNRPELLPSEPTPVIDVAGFLTPSEERRIASQVEALERDTGFKLRVLAQNYPETPGLAIREFWAVDDSSIVFVADPSFGDILNFNVGGGVDLEVPRSFWSRLAGKYGNKFYWQEKGEAAAILNAVNAVDTCLREPSGRAKCNTVQGGFDE